MGMLHHGRCDSVVEGEMRAFWQTLSEKDKRRFAALESRRCGRGGPDYVAGVLGCSRRTIERGTAELKELPVDPAAGRVRRPGGGRKKKVEAEPELARNLKAILEVRTAGDPDEPDVLWTDLSPREIAETVTTQGTPVSPPVVQH
ncbi:hypothetical protein B1B_09570, partial [mine drainage metagenome]